MRALDKKMDAYSPFFREPTVYIQKAGYRVVYAFKESVHFFSSFTGAPGDLPSLLRKVTEAVGPALAHLRGFEETWKAGMRHFVGLVEACDLLEVVNDAQYFLNGGWVKDRAKGRIYSVIAHVALVPADIITVVLHVKDVFKLSFEALGNFAAIVGNVRLFGFVPKLAAFAQDWPLIRSIPNLAEKAAAVSEVRPLGFVSKISLGNVALTAVTVAYVYFLADAWKRRNAAVQKSKKYEAELSKANVKVQSNDGNLKALFDRAKVDYETVDRDQKEALGKDFVKYKSKQIKLQQANLDLWRNSSELALKAASFGGIAVGATVASSVTIGILGAFSILCIGRAAYHRFSAKAPTLKAATGLVDV